MSVRREQGERRADDVEATTTRVTDGCSIVKKLRGTLVASTEGMI